VKLAENNSMEAEGMENVVIQRQDDKNVSQEKVLYVPRMMQFDECRSITKEMLLGNHGR
jgi:hypothetical protein